MRLWTLPFRLLGLLGLSLLISVGWLLRKEILGMVRPQVARVAEVIEQRGATSITSPADAARDKVDSLHGWSADSVVLTAAEMTALLLDGLPAEARGHLDSVKVTLGQSRVSIQGLLETSQIPRDLLGPLAGVVRTWEPVTVAGDVAIPRPGHAEWKVDALTLRGITLPADASRALIERALPGAREGRVPLTLPDGVSRITVRPAGVAVFREQTR
ncbi:MAG: hypothetical protein ABI587_02960 [Gemmatimonadales bacterium]